MRTELHVGNPGNTTAFICDCMLSDMKSGVRPKSFLWSRDEDTAINAICPKCNATMNEDRCDEVKLAIVAEEKIIRMIEEDMKGQMS